MFHFMLFHFHAWKRLNFVWGQISNSSKVYRHTFNAYLNLIPRFRGVIIKRWLDIKFRTESIYCDTPDTVLLVWSCRMHLLGPESLTEGGRILCTFFWNYGTIVYCPWDRTEGLHQLPSRYWHHYLLASSRPILVQSIVLKHLPLHKPWPNP